MNHHLAYKGSLVGIRRLCLILLPLLGACRREPATEPTPPLTAEQQERKQLVLQPKPDWRPEGAARKLNVLLLIDKTIVRTGEPFHYRLEMQNAGGVPLTFKETAPSFIKDGSLCGDASIKFYATPPEGKETLLPCEPKGAAEVRASTAPAQEPESGLELTLQPGEYLLTRGSGPKNRFRRLRTKFPFEALGKYRLKAAYFPADGLRAVSNTVTLEVVP